MKYATLHKQVQLYIMCYLKSILKQTKLRHTVGIFFFKDWKAKSLIHNLAMTSR